MKNSNRINRKIGAILAFTILFIPQIAFGWCWFSCGANLPFNKNYPCESMANKVTCDNHQATATQCNQNKNKLLEDCKSARERVADLEAKSKLESDRLAAAKANGNRDTFDEVTSLTGEGATKKMDMTQVKLEGGNNAVETKNGFLDSLRHYLESPAPSYEGLTEAQKQQAYDMMNRISEGKMTESEISNARSALPNSITNQLSGAVLAHGLAGKFASSGAQDLGTAGGLASTSASSMGLGSSMGAISPAQMAPLAAMAGAANTGQGNGVTDSRGGSSGLKTPDAATKDLSGAVQKDGAGNSQFSFNLNSGKTGNGFQNSDNGAAAGDDKPGGVALDVASASDKGKRNTASLSDELRKKYGSNGGTDPGSSGASTAGNAAGKSDALATGKDKAGNTADGMSLAGGGSSAGAGVGFGKAESDAAKLTGLNTSVDNELAALMDQMKFGPDGLPIGPDGQPSLPPNATPEQVAAFVKAYPELAAKLSLGDENKPLFDRMHGLYNKCLKKGCLAFGRQKNQ